MNISLRQIKNIFKREITVYLTTPPAYVFIVIFLLLSSFFTFASSPFGNLLDTNETSLNNSFFMFHPWLFLVLIPAIGMRLWPEEIKSGTVELLLTMPVSIIDAVIGKYLAALFITLLALLLTSPLIITVNWLGEPDNNIILCGYAASFLLAASYLALTSLFSAVTKSQIISFIISFVICMLLALIGHPSMTDFFIEWAPVWFTDLLLGLSIFPHFETMQKGILDFQDILYFASLIFGGIIGTYMLLKKKSGETVIKIFFLFIILLNANFIINSGFSIKKDFTLDTLYTLSPGTKNILKHIKYPISIRYYCSYKNNRLPIQLRGYANRINDLLKEYVSLSSGKIRLERFDPVPDSDYETSAVIDGIHGQLLKNGEKCYFGIAISCMGKNEVISFLSPSEEKTIEYDITRAIYEVSNFKKTVVGVLSSLPVMGGLTSVIPLKTEKKMPWIFIQEIQKVLEVKNIEYNTEYIGNDIDLLIIVHPKNISIETEFAIDQYLLNGGKIVAFLDPYCISDYILTQSKYLPGLKAVPTSSNLEHLINAWGLNFSHNDQVVISPQNAFKPANSMEKEHPAIIELSGDKYLNPKSIVTSNLNKLDIIFSGTFYGNLKQGIEKEVLVKTDKFSNVFNGFSVNIPSESILNSFVSGNNSLDIALRLTGNFTTAFPEKVNNDMSDELNDDNKKYLLKSKKTSSVVLIGDADMLFNPFCVAKKQIYDQTVIDVINSNLDFVLNIVDQQSGSQDIIGIRTRGTKKREFNKFDQIINTAKKKYRKKISTLEKQLAETSKYISDIQDKQQNKKILKLNGEQINILRKYKLEQKNTEKKLRELRKRLRANLDELKFKIKLFDIAIPPFLVIVIGLIVCFFRLKSYKKKY